MSDNSVIPDKMLAWRLFGAGMEKLGVNDSCEEIPVPTINDDELLVRIDAIGLCFSDIKLIRAGEAHPRVISENLETDPVIPGHEAVMTIVKVGDKADEDFKVGQRFIIQADIYVNGKGFAYGYAINGGMAQYSRIDQRVLKGDEGRYLLPLADDTPAGIAALIEPWTCVIASYLIEPRTAPASEGKVLVVSELTDSNTYHPGEALIEAKPSQISLLDVSGETVALFRREFPDSEIVILDEAPEGQAFDDLFLCNLKNREKAEKLAKLCSRDAVINFIGEYPDEAWAFDVGNIHYEGWFYQGGNGDDLSAAYGRNVRSKLKPGGTCWLPGGAGAMGQMHTQLAVEDPNGPTRILVSDLDDTRISNVEKLLSSKIKERGIEFKTMNPSSFASTEEFEAAVAEFAPDGFDDVIMLVPVVPVLNSSAKFLKEDGLMNIFAGIPAGKEGDININDIVAKGARFIGSSGSMTWHLRHTLEMAESKSMEPATALAAIGGMKDLKKGLEAVADATFPGKTVIFPQCVDMPLTTIDEINNLDESLPGTLSGEGLYTMETEKALFKHFES